MARAMDVADLIITKAQDAKLPVSNLKLQKVMYFLNAIHLLEFKTPLITDANFEKWDYGPVIHSVYSEYSSFGANEINKPELHATLTKDDTGKFKVSFAKFNASNLNKDDRTFIQRNLGSFINFDPFTLVDESHLEPQWQDRHNNLYDDQKTINFYNNKNNRFWEK